MMKFLDLLKPEAGLAPGRQQLRAGCLFPDLVAASKLNLWKSGDPIAAVGKRILLGVGASYSCPDLALLDILNEAPDLPARVDVFDVAACHSSEDCLRYIPGLRVVGTTPIVGVWENSDLVFSGLNREAFQVVSQLLGIGSNELLEMVLVATKPFRFER